MFDPKALAARLVEARGHKRPGPWAERLGLAPEELAQIEAGAVAPSLECLYRVHQAAGINLHWLITGEGDKYETPGGRAGPGRGRRFSDQSLARLAIGLLQETSLPRHQCQILGDLVLAAVCDPRKRETILLLYRFLKFAELPAEPDPER